MFRKLLAVLAFALTGLLMLSASALAAPPYPAPPAYPAPPVVTVDGAPVPGASVDTATTLASTGAGFPVGATVLITVIVLIVGVGLVVLGRRLRQSRNR